MAEKEAQTLEQFRAKLDCRTGVQMRVTDLQQENTTSGKEKPSAEIRECRSGVGSRISGWKTRESDFTKRSQSNVFSDGYKPGLRVADSEYGTPEAGSRTDQRGRDAGQHISNEVCELCEIIAELGQRTGPTSWSITFGPLFETYTRISSKLVGMLMRARRQGLVHFEGEMLFQGRDNDVEITLLKDPSEIENVKSVRQNVVRRN